VLAVLDELSLETLDQALHAELHALEHGHSHGGHDHAHDHTHDHEHEHQIDIQSVSLSTTKPLDADRVTRWLQGLLQEKGQDILRMKGILDIRGRNERLIFQAVHMVMEGDFQRPWEEDEKRYSRIVFIGRNLDEAELERGFAACVA
jgi:G3E family GTPase